MSQAAASDTAMKLAKPMTTAKLRFVAEFILLPLSPGWSGDHASDAQRDYRRQLSLLCRCQGSHKCIWFGSIDYGGNLACGVVRPNV